MARNTDYVYIRGKLKWVRTTAVNPWGKYTCTVYPLPGEDLEKVRELQSEGVKNLLKKDDDGYYITYSRPSEKTDKNGRKFGLAPVEIMLKDGSKFDGNVGNGSDGTVKLEVYQHSTPSGGKAKAARLLAIRVDELVPYEPNRDMQKDQEMATRGLQFAPAQPTF
jgi:hypothetical protein